MIEGLKFLMSSEELRTHLVARIQHHQGRREFYAKQADELDRGHAEGMQYSNGDPVRNLRDKSAEHQRKVEAFTFMHDHVVPNEEYQLQDADLMRIEVLTTRNY